MRGRLRISRYLNPGLWTAWRWAAFRLPARYREDLLGSSGPLSLVLLLIAWVALLLLGYGPDNDQADRSDEGLGTIPRLPKQLQLNSCRT